MTPTRVHYFNGQLLSAEDFQTEQTYWLEKHRRHHRYTLGFGIVNGLAIDCAGNELLVPVTQALTLTPAKTPQYVTLAYEERLTQPLPAADGNTPFSRTEEITRVAVTNVDPNATHPKMAPGSPGCGTAHPLAIARLVRQRGAWRIAVLAKKVRRR